MGLSILLVKLWCFESRLASIGLLLGDKLVYDVGSNRMNGCCTGMASEPSDIELEIFKDSPDVWYSEDGGRHVFLAGKRLCSGEGAAQGNRTLITVKTRD